MAATLLLIHDTPEAINIIILAQNILNENKIL